MSKIYPGGVEAIRDLSLSIADGELIVLVGPSGCGKTTLLRMIAGLEAVTSGGIGIGDRDVTRLAPRDRDIAMVFQSYALYPQMRVWDNLAFALKLRRTPRTELRAKVGSVAALLGLDPVVGRKPGSLSGGQRQRVAIGRAMVREPSVYLMDEPLSNLDAKLRVGMRAALARLHARLGVTTVYVTHDQVEAMTLGDRVAVIRDGVVQQCDTPQTVFDHPANLFVATFMGSPPMNLIQANASGGNVRFAGITLPLPGLSSQVQGPVIIGIRPTDLVIEDSDRSDRRLLSAKIDSLERLGSESHVMFAIDVPRPEGLAAEAAGRAEAEGDGVLLASDRQTWLTARVANRPDLRVGETIDLAIRAEAVHLFDPTTGSALR